MEKFIQKIDAVKVVKKLPDGMSGNMVANKNKDAERTYRFVLFL
tara:strand:+ start:523 stop:654 length:132 start_codon:yes stop_codon:yes gene_type:complete